MKTLGMALVLVAWAVAGLGPAHAASATVCGPTWHMTTVGPFTFTPPMMHSFELTSLDGPCAGSTADGMLNGVCFGATGGGTFEGRSFSLAWRGGSLVFTGGVTGTLAIVADATTGDACVDGQADDFALAGPLTLA